MTLNAKTSDVLEEVYLERERQDAKWGEQNHPDYTGISEVDRMAADAARKMCDEAFKSGVGAWRYILLEEVLEAFAESDPARLRAELIQVAAVAIAWVECIDRRGGK